MKQTDEWLEADGLGGFASGTATGPRTRRYHALLLAATTPPTGRVVLVNGFDAWIETPDGQYALTSQRYAPDTTAPDGGSRLQSFDAAPWPKWTYQLESGLRIEHELTVRKGMPGVILTWKIAGRKKANVSLVVKPFLSGRDYHSLQHENPAFRFEPEEHAGKLIWRPYDGVAGIVAAHNGEYAAAPDWYRNFLYEVEQERGLDHVEDLATPGAFRFNLSKGEAALILGVEGHTKELLPAKTTAPAAAKKHRTAEKTRRNKLKEPLLKAADAYLVARGAGSTIVAGYPWFTDWGRDTFIALRGLCLAADKLDLARDILLTWSEEAVSQGMLPNRFPDQGTAPEYNSVDASLWFIIAVHDYFEALKRKKKKPKKAEQIALEKAVDALLAGYRQGTRFGIKVDEDGLLRAGQPGVALTWMDACVDGHVVTPRIGKPVEIQALWLNALWTRRSCEECARLLEQGLASFRARFWNEEAGCLFDVIDGEAGNDSSIRPNQIFAVGGLPIALVEKEQAARVLQVVEEKLWTPRGLRTLAPGSPGYCGQYTGGRHERDHAYHQGTVWPWLLGPFVDAWLHVHGKTAKLKKEARQRFLEPMLAGLDEYGLGHLAEIHDGDEPHAPHGCPFQAWSVGEALRLERVVL
ncbi:MAG: amylo-alpha-1,6-glucosidase [Gemmataceae bacterium]